MGGECGWVGGGVTERKYTELEWTERKGWGNGKKRREQIAYNTLQVSRQKETRSEKRNGRGLDKSGEGVGN